MFEFVVMGLVFMCINGVCALLFMHKVSVTFTRREIEAFIERMVHGDAYIDKCAANHPPHPEVM